jgi:predicted NUDIX family NTP pyrophosphohydrolase
MSKVSAGILLFRRGGPEPEVLLVHPGGPFWASRDAGAWSIPKGEVQPEEDVLAAAVREFREETGLAAEGAPVSLGSIRQKGGKEVHAWALEGECDPSSLRSNVFTMEWPPRSGKLAEFPEVDRAAFFTVGEARVRLNPAQAPFLDRLMTVLGTA